MAIMCVRTIIDKNMFHHFLERTKNSAGEQLRSWIRNRHGLIVYTEKDTGYGKELRENKHVLSIIEDFRKRNFAIVIETEKVADANKRLPSKDTLKSDDPHVLALALASDAKVLFSCDGDLCEDFKNVEVIPKVAGGRHIVPDLDQNNSADTKGSQRRREFFNRRRCPQQ